MPPKRKNTDTDTDTTAAAAVDRPEKKNKATRKAAKAAPETTESKSHMLLLSFMIVSANGLGGRRTARCRASLSPPS
jgi:hypothetical protein